MTLFEINGYAKNIAMFNVKKKQKRMFSIAQQCDKT